MYFSYLCIEIKHNSRNMEANEALLTILKKSHAQAMAGQTVPMDEVESFMKNVRMDDATMLAKLNQTILLLSAKHKHPMPNLFIISGWAFY